MWASSSEEYPVPFFLGKDFYWFEKDFKVASACLNDSKCQRGADQRHVRTGTSLRLFRKNKFTVDIFNSKPACCDPSVQYHPYVLQCSTQQRQAVPVQIPSSARLVSTAAILTLAILTDHNITIDLNETKQKKRSLERAWDRMLKTKESFSMLAAVDLRPGRAHSNDIRTPF
jgi:hypothetical protein